MRPYGLWLASCVTVVGGGLGSQRVARADTAGSSAFPWLGPGVSRLRLPPSERTTRSSATGRGSTGLTGTRRRATGSAASKRLSSATAPRSGTPSAAIRHGVVTSSPSRRILTSASGQSSCRPPAVSIGHVRKGRSASRSASARGTTRNVAPVSTRIVCLTRPRSPPPRSDSPGARARPPAPWWTPGPARRRIRRGRHESPRDSARR